MTPAELEALAERVAELVAARLQPTTIGARRARRLDADKARASGDALLEKMGFRKRAKR